MIFKLCTTSLAIVMAIPAVAAVNMANGGSFEDHDLGAGQKDYFHSAGMIGWNQVGSVYVAAPVAEDTVAPVHVELPETGPKDGPVVLANGTRGSTAPFWQTVSGLTIDQNNTPSFWQVESNLNYWNLDTPMADRWQVSFADRVYHSDLFELEELTYGDWELETMRFTAAHAPQAQHYEVFGKSEIQRSALDGDFMQTAVPEPATWAMMIGGFGMVGFVMRRKRQVAGVTA